MGKGFGRNGNNQTIKGKNFSIDDPMLAVWRNINGEFVPCSPGASKPVCSVVEFDLDDYKDMVARVIGVEAEELPIGYYYAHHELQRGNYLGTDDFDEMVVKLKEKGLA